MNKIGCLIWCIILPIICSSCQAQTKENNLRPTANNTPMAEKSTLSGSFDPTLTYTTPPTSTIAPTTTKMPLPTSTPMTTCFDHELSTSLDDPGIPENPTIKAKYTFAEVKAILQNEPYHFHLYEKNIHHRDIMIAIDDGMKFSQEYVDYFFNLYAHYWEIFGGNPFPYFVLIVQSEHSPVLEQKFLLGTYCVPYINEHEGNKDVIGGMAEAIVEIWMGEGGSCMHGPEWFVISNNPYYNYRFAPAGYISHDISSIMAYFEKEMMQNSQYYGLGLATIPSTNYSENDHVYGEWDGFKVLYMLDELLTKNGYSLDDVYRQLYLTYGKEPGAGSFTNEDIEETLRQITGMDFSDIFQSHVYNYSSFEEKKYPYICHNGYLEPTDYYVAFHDLKTYYFSKTEPVPLLGSEAYFISFNNDSIFETVNWETPDVTIPDQYNNTQIPLNMDFDEVDFYYEESGLYIRIKANQSFYLGESAIDIRLTESDGQVYGLTIHPSSDTNSWNCKECTGDWLQSDEIKASWGDEVFIYIPWEAIGKEFEVNQLWMSFNYPAASGDWTSADMVEWNGKN